MKESIYTLVIDKFISYNNKATKLRWCSFWILNIGWYKTSSFASGYFHTI